MSIRNSLVALFLLLATAPHADGVSTGIGGSDGISGGSVGGGSGISGAGVKIIQFFVNTATGNDGAAGTQAAPWLTLNKVNTSVFQPNTQVNLQGTFAVAANGLIITTTVAPSGRVTFTSYGAGATIQSGNSTACVTVTNVPSVTVSNLTCTGGGNLTNTTDGITVVNTQAGNTTLAGPTIIGNTVSGYGNNGIFVNGSNGTSGWNGVTVSNNTVHDATGVTGGGKFSCIQAYANGAGESRTAFTNVSITGNTVFNCTGAPGAGTNWSGTGIFIGSTTTGMVQNNVVHDSGGTNTSCGAGYGIWGSNSVSITIQFNEVYNFSSTGGCDSGGMDVDGGASGWFVQYNYIHDNFGPCVLMFEYLADTNSWSNNTFRFNICQNNSMGNVAVGQIYLDNANTNAGGTFSGAQVYNNTVYTGTSPIPAILVGKLGGPITSGNVANNIFYGVAANTLISVGSTGTAVGFNGNDYFGSAKFTYNGTSYTTYPTFKSGAGVETINGGFSSNPHIYVPGGGWANGGNGHVIANLYAYNLQAGSPMLPNAGINLATQFSLSVGTQDFYGNAVTAATMPVGAAAADFGSFVASCTASSSFLPRTSSFTKANNANYNSLLCGMNSDGDLALIDTLYMLAAPNSAASLLNLKNASFPLTPHGATTFAANTGINSDGTTGYLDTGFNPSTAGGNYTLNSASAGCYDLTSHAVSAGWCLGNNDTVNGSPLMQASSVFMNEGTGMTCGGTVVNTQGSWIGKRTSSLAAGETCSFDGGLLGTGFASTALVNLSVFLFAQNHSGTADTFLAGNQQLSSAFIGGGGISVPNVSRRLNSFMTALGVNVY
jgi:hypothetical protein